MARLAEAAPAARSFRARWLLPVMILGVSVGLSYGAYRLASYAWDQVVSYESPYTSISGVDFSGARPNLTDPIPEATPRRVVMVLIDGLRDDASRTMDSLTALRTRGADVRLTAPQPSLSYPTWTTALTGAPPQVSGVTTNWFEGPVAVETLLDVAAGSGRTVVVSGPKDLDDMFSASTVATATTLIDWDAAEYRSGTIVDNALSLDAEVGGADFIFVLLPDVDDAGHDFGAASEKYADVVAKVDDDLARLIDGLDDGQTTFVVLPDHGHIDTGGHGGWEEPVVRTFVALAGPGVAKTTAEADLADVAPTVAVIAGLQAPTQATGTAIDAVLSDGNGRARDAEFVRSAGVTLSYIRKVLGEEGIREFEFESIESPTALATLRADAEASRLTDERSGRVGIIVGTIAALLALALALGVASWRALLAALAGLVTYAAVYNGLFFGVHRLAWSLSAFNEETAIDAFFNARMIETVVAGVVGCLVATFIYAALRRPAGARTTSAADWLAFGGATVLLMQGALALQAALYLWRWGAGITWLLPDFREAFKFDLDLIQLTALGAVAIIGPLVAWGVGSLHARLAARS